MWLTDLWLIYRTESDAKNDKKDVEDKKEAEISDKSESKTEVTELKDDVKDGSKEKENDIISTENMEIDDKE